MTALVIQYRYLMASICLSTRSLVFLTPSLRLAASWVVRHLIAII